MKQSNYPDLVRRLIINSLANSGGVIIGAIVQFASVPILIYAWGVSGYGVWTMLSTIPTYISLSDFGLFQASSNDMAMAHALHQRKRVVESYHNLFLFVSIACTVVLILAATLWASGLLLSSIGSDLQGRQSIQPVIAILVVYSLVSLQSRVPLAALRATGHYAVGSSIFDIGGSIEALVMLVVAYLSRSFMMAAVIALGFRSLMLCFLYVVSIRQSPWLRIGFVSASRHGFKKMLAPSLGALAIPAGLAISLQGTVLIMGTIISPAAVALYSPIRTASRILVQVCSIVSRGSMPEVSRHVALNASSSLARIVKINTISFMAFLVPGALLFGCFGAYMIKVWSGGKLQPSIGFVMIVAIATVLHAIWYNLVNLLIAANAHIALSMKVLTLSIVSLAIIAILSYYFDMNGAGFGVLISEGLLLLFVVGSWRLSPLGEELAQC